LPLLKKHYLLYADYAGEVMKDVFYGWIDTIKPLRAERLGSAVCYGNGKGTFEIKDLPAELQLSPIFSFQKLPGTEKRYLSGGNFYDVIPYEGRYDAQPLALFMVSKSGVINVFHQPHLAGLKGQVRDIKWLQNGSGNGLMVVARNNDSLTLYKMAN
jgi:hypothetical protein